MKYHVLYNPLANNKRAENESKILSDFIRDEDIVAEHNFDRRTVNLEFSKKQVSYFREKFVSDYILIDFHDATRSFYEINNNSDIRIVESPFITKSLSKMGKSVSYELKNPFNISDYSWGLYMDAFIELLHEKYTDDHIILNEFLFAESYLDNGEYKLFSSYLNDKKKFCLASKLNSMFKKKLPNVKVLDSIVKPLADKNHFLSLASTHYVEDYYQIQATRLLSFFSELEYESVDVNKMIDSYNKKYFPCVFENLSKTESLLLKKYYTLRIDVKNESEPGMNCEIYNVSDSDAVITCPNWFKNSKGDGFTVTSWAKQLKFSVKCVKPGSLKMSLRGIDIRSIVPGEENIKQYIYIPIFSYKINSVEMLNTGIKVVNIDSPLSSNISVKNGDVIDVELEWGIM